jgi:Mn2+/Fe2+ NRAMP family transporter
MRSTLAYTSARILLFVAAMGVLYLAGARGLLLIALALLVSGIVSFVVLSRQRDAMSAAFAGRIHGFRSRLDAGSRAEDGDGTTSASDPR